MTDKPDSLPDRLVRSVDNALRTLFTPANGGRRDNPADGMAAVPRLEPEERRHAAGLMRVNQSGEVAAQGLYQGHALVARDPALVEKLDHAAAEERDHLNWCTQRLDELGARPSLLNGVWYGGAFALGALSGIAGDRYGLGFIAETERQVVRHLNGHLQRLPARDERSRRILERMRDEEEQHGDDATNSGGEPLPPLAQRMMQRAAKVMTTTAYWI